MNERQILLDRIAPLMTAMLAAIAIRDRTNRSLTDGAASKLHAGARLDRGSAVRRDRYRRRTNLLLQHFEGV
jgi:hypothetical protein